MGGNVKIGDCSADRINLNDINRTEFTESLKELLFTINEKFISGACYKDAIQSGEIFSGSSKHLFDSAISDSEFVKYKPTLGDIDVQVDSTLQNVLSKRVFPVIPSGTLITKEWEYKGSKSSAGQTITLFRNLKFNVNVQIDFEYVDFEDCKPTEWSKFSRSSDWQDIKLGIKGVFHKYILQSILSARPNKMLIKAKSSRSQDEIIERSIYSFSITYGIRQKFNLTGDMENDISVAYELPTSNPINYTNFDDMILILFDAIATPEDIKKLYSFSGCIDLISKYFNKDEQKTIVVDFMKRLWGKRAQKLYRDNNSLDHKEKAIALDLMTSTLDINTPDLENLIEEYYC